MCKANTADLGDDVDDVPLFDRQLIFILRFIWEEDFTLLSSCQWHTEIRQEGNRELKVRRAHGRFSNVKVHIYVSVLQNEQKYTSREKIYRQLSGSVSPLALLSDSVFMVSGATTAAFPSVACGKERWKKINE